MKTEKTLMADQERKESVDDEVMTAATVTTVFKGSLVSQDPRANVVDEVSRASEVPTDHRDLTAPTVRRENLVLAELLVNQDMTDPKVTRADTETEEPKDDEDQTESLQSEVREEPKECEDSTDTQDLLDKRENAVLPGFRDGTA